MPRLGERKSRETKMLERSVPLWPEQLAALRALSAASKVPQQVFIRAGLDLVLARECSKQG